MGKKSKARAKRKARKFEKFEKSKTTILAKVQQERKPTFLSEPVVANTPRLPPHLERERIAKEKKPIAIKDGSRFGSIVTWCCTNADLKDSWSWGEERQWTADEWERTILPTFQEFAKITWGEISQASSESGHRMHHDHSITDIITEAQERWIYLDLEQYDTLFRFRLGGTKRAWGYIVQAHFFLVWWDRTHNIYPVD